MPQQPTRNVLTDAEAFAEFYQRHSPALWQFLLLRTGQASAAEDLFQDAFQKFFKQLQQTCGVDPAAMLFTCARSVLIDFMRRRAVRERFARTEHAGTPAGKPAADADGFQQAAAAALRELPAEQADVVLLHLYEDMQFPEISRLLDIPYDTAVSRYRYGLDKLKQKLKQWEQP